MLGCVFKLICVNQFTYDPNYGAKSTCEVEGLHQICFEYGQYGHLVEECPKNTPVSAPTGDKGQTMANSTGAEKVQAPTNYRPWMLVNNHCRRNVSTRYNRQIMAFPNR